MKTILFTLLCVISLGVLRAQSVASEETTLFAQSLFSIDSREDMLQLESELRNHPNIAMVRLDFETQRSLIYTKGIGELTEEEYRSWFGEFAESVRCIQIGVNGVDKLNQYPYENCN